MLLSNLPKEIILKTGEVLKPYIGHLKQREVIAACKESGKKFRKVRVLNRRLRGVTDAHGKPYAASEWVFTNLKDEEPEQPKLERGAASLVIELRDSCITVKHGQHKDVLHSSKVSIGTWSKMFNAIVSVITENKI